MSIAPTKLLTADEFFDFVTRPENQDRHFELERGVIIEMPRPGERQGLVCGNVVWVLGNYIRQRRKGFVMANDTGIIWERGPDTVKGPDVAYSDTVRRYRDLNPRFSDRIPKLVVEVLSPNDRWSKVTRRIQQFLKWGVPLVWIVDPDARDVTVYRRGQEPYVVEREEELTGNGVLPDFRCKVEDFFFMPEDDEKPAASRGPKKKKR